MKIQTIHSFCQSLLARFPLRQGSAALSPDRGAGRGRAPGRRPGCGLGRFTLPGGEALAEAVERISPLAAEQDFTALLRALIGSAGVCSSC